MKSKKKFFIILPILLLIVGIALFFLFLEKKTLEEREFTASINSVIYRIEGQELIADISNKGWQKEDFKRYIADTSSEGKNIACGFFVVDVLNGNKVTFAGERICNSYVNITVGPEAMCQSQGEGSCMLYAYAVDDNGKQGEYGLVSYNIDYEKPEVKIAKPSLTFKKGQSIGVSVQVKDNVSVDYCWLRGKSFLSMGIFPNLCKANQDCVAQTNYAPKETENVVIQCSDHFDAVRNEYVNLSQEQELTFSLVNNQSPVVSCEVSASVGKTDTDFVFTANAQDPNSDEVLFAWDFGDGVKADTAKASHVYTVGGIYYPKVEVVDTEGALSVCSPVWVTVKE